jgi:alpha-tubulin suppressor-like RCC1 family protein
MLRRVLFALFAFMLALSLLGEPSVVAAERTVQRTADLTSLSVGPTWLVVSAGTGHTCAIRDDHSLWCWGWNRNGQLGLGHLTSRRVPAQVGTDTDWAHIDAGEEHTCGVRFDHTLWCWGWNGFGQLGFGDHENRRVPTQVGTDSDWVHIDTGSFHSCGTRLDHTLWCWGWNKYGQLGLGQRKRERFPTQVGTSADWTSPHTGHEYTCGIRLDRSLWCWGRNADGQLGLGDTVERRRPTPVGTGNWLHVTAGGFWRADRTCAIRTNHTLWCWGANWFGELGVGDTQGRTVPTQVGPSTDWVHVSADTGDNHTCATRSDDTLWCWGLNADGQLGLGHHKDRKIPTQVGTSTDWSRLNTGDEHTCALRTDHTLWCWGLNDHGQLGLGDHKSRSTPTRV